MPSSAATWVDALSAEMRGLDPEEQLAATLHMAMERFVAEGCASEKAGYFLLSAARAALDDCQTFSVNCSLARGYIDAALQLLSRV